MKPAECDLLLSGARRVYTLDAGPGVLPEPEMLAALPVHDHGAVAVVGGKIAAVGPAAELSAAFAARERYDAGGGIIVPGFVDAHSHPAFVGDRAEEFEWRAQGLSYVEIARRGGGILSSVQALRAATAAELQAAVAQHFGRMQRHGTVACEAKSGYGLSTADEIKSLQAIDAAARATGMEVFPTFLGAHQIPAEHRAAPDRYLDMLCAEALPEVRAQGLARAADVFIEGHAFDLQRARRYLERARELGLALRVHADQFERLGGVSLAVELGAESVDHLEVLDDHGLEALALSRATYAGLLPAVPHFLRSKADAPARKLLTARVPYFVATDFNPGSCYTPSLVEAAHFARVRLNLSAWEALAGVSLYAAASLGVAGRKGRIARGYDADLVVLDLPDASRFGYAFGENPVRAAFGRGRLLGGNSPAAPAHP